MQFHLLVGGGHKSSLASNRVDNLISPYFFIFIFCSVYKYITYGCRLISQYGFVNHALELLVLRNYGPEVWEDIK